MSINFGAVKLSLGRPTIMMTQAQLRLSYQNRYLKRVANGTWITKEQQGKGGSATLGKPKPKQALSLYCSKDQQTFVRFHRRARCPLCGLKMRLASVKRNA